MDFEASLSDSTHVAKKPSDQHHDPIREAATSREAASAV
jgi:hypothetical protein